MLDVAVDREDLAGAIVEAGGARYCLKPLEKACTYPVFRGEADGLPPVFVKVGTADEWRRTERLVRDVGSCGLFPKLLPGSRIEYRGHAVFVMEWKETEVVYPENMTERQVDSFADACVMLSGVLQSVRDFTPIDGSPFAPECMYEELVRYVRRHPVAGRLLKDLVSVSAAERTFGTRPLAVVHGDFHAKNFGFSGDKFASVFDFDKLTQGLLCGDLTDALVERYSCLGLSASARRRLDAVARRLVARVPWPREEFVISCNVARLRFAVRRVRKHPDSAWVAIDVLRRDRKISEFLTALGRSSPHQKMV